MVENEDWAVALSKLPHRVDADSLIQRAIASQEAREAEVTEADKDAAAELAHAIRMSCEDFTSWGADVLVQAFARHRQSAERGEVANAAFSAVNTRGQTKTIESVDELLRLINGGAMLRDVRRITLPTPPEAA